MIDWGSFLAVNTFGAVAVVARVLFRIVFSIFTTVVRQVRRDGFAKVEGGSGTSATGIFPFGFGGKAVGVVGEAREALAKLYCVMPGNLFNGALISLELRGIGIKVDFDFQIGTGGNGAPLSLGNGVAAH